jgi:8-oxo-dGTP pyrophosphatase MutT (NUDIX family)
MAEDSKENKMDEFARRLSSAKKEKTQTIMAATVVLIRDTSAGIETLMLRKNSKIAFGGMSVFPGGRIDDDDGEPDDDMLQRARVAAVREAAEETALEIKEDGLTWFSHWTPPPLGNRRFITWFFVARAPEGEVVIDDGEIKGSQWLSPTSALEKHAAGDIELVPPTFVSLHQLSAYATVDDALAGMEQGGPDYYATHIGQLDGDLVAMWEGDAGWTSSDPELEGARHRLRMKSGGWEYENGAG